MLTRAYKLMLIFALVAVLCVVCVATVPRIPFLMRFKALTHPSRDDMVEYFRGGEAAAFPKICRIQNNMLLERTLEECVRVLSKQKEKEQDKRSRRIHRHQQNHAHRQQQQQPQHEHTTYAHAAAAGHGEATQQELHPSSSSHSRHHHQHHHHGSTAAAAHSVHHIGAHAPVLSSSTDAAAAASTAAAGGHSTRRSGGVAPAACGTLPEAMSTAASRRSFSTPAALHLHCSPSSPGSSGGGSTAGAVLAQLPMHGARDSTTDTEDAERLQDYSPEAAGVATATSSSSSSAGSAAGAGSGSGRGRAPLCVEEETSSPPYDSASGSNSRSGSGSGCGSGSDDGGVSSERSTNASHMDPFDAEEAANQELIEDVLLFAAENDHDMRSDSASGAGSSTRSSIDAEPPLLDHAPPAATMSAAFALTSASASAGVVSAPSIAAFSSSPPSSASSSALASAPLTTLSPS